MNWLLVVAVTLSVTFGASIVAYFFATISLAMVLAVIVGSFTASLFMAFVLKPRKFS